MSDTSARPRAGAADITERAADWIERRTRATWNDQDEVLLRSWLSESASHRIAFWRLEAAWNETSRLTALRRPGGFEQRSTARSKARPNLSKALAAAIVAGILGYTAFGYVAPHDAVYSTGLGERKTLTLADGSKIELNTNSLLRTAANGNARTVWLDKGEAYFDVKHDATHPFVVIASERRITDLGTQFNVRADGSRLKVAVLEGRVSFAGTNGKAVTELRAGDTVVAQAGKISLTRVPESELADRIGWRSGKLLFHHTPLFQVAEEFNRYNGTKVTVEGEVARDLTINGTFATNDVQAFARIAQTVLGLKVDDQGSKIVISR